MWQISESEGVLMIISYSPIFGVTDIIIFQPTELIAIFEKSIKAVLRLHKNMLGFPYLANPTRHEVP